MSRYMKVQSKNYGTTYGVAKCTECDWGDMLGVGEDNPLERLRLRVKRHVRATGHVVTMESGGVIDYYIEKKDG